MGIHALGVDVWRISRSTLAKTIERVTVITIPVDVGGQTRRSESDLDPMFWNGDVFGGAEASGRSYGLKDLIDEVLPAG